MTDTPDDDAGTEPLWIGECTCGQQFRIADDVLSQTYPQLQPAFQEGEFITACPECDADVLIWRQEVKVIPFSAWQILPPASGCSECGRDHADWMPHDRQQMVYQYAFYAKENRWPTWHDAMAHCTDDVKRDWIKALAKHGVRL